VAAKGTATTSAAPSAQVLAGSHWLGEVNVYREAAGLQPVTDQPAWDAGLLDHFEYLRHTPKSYLRGPYASMHTENPASPYYTAAGAHEAASSDLIADATTSPVHDIDSWLACPFHAVGILRASLGQTAFASADGYAGLDVVNGLNEQRDAQGPILFPGPGMTTDLTSYCGNEYPSPLQTCGWTGDYDLGLPLVALLTSAPSTQLAASLQETDGGAAMTPANGDLCVVDASTYKTTDTVYGPTGASILTGDNAVFLIPRSTLRAGTYHATLDQPGRPKIVWSFGVAPLQATAARAMADPLANPAANRRTPLLAIKPGTCIVTDGSARCPSPCYPNGVLRYNASRACIGLVLRAVNSAQAAEHLHRFTLPSNYFHLSATRQMFVLVNLERESHGVPLLVGLSPYLSAAATRGARRAKDPPFRTSYGPVQIWLPPGGGTYRYGGVWAGNTVNAASALFGWFYDDGWGGRSHTLNVACTGPTSSGCWSHRDELLGEWSGTSCTDCVAGAGYASPAARRVKESFDFLIVRPVQFPTPLVFTWNRDVLPYLPAGWERERAL
jgi:hypothetical protein